MFSINLQQICNAVIEWTASKLLLAAEFIDQLECPLSPEVLCFYTHEYEEWLNSALLPSDPSRALTEDKAIQPEQFAVHVHWAFPRYPHMARFVPFLQRSAHISQFDPPFFSLSIPWTCVQSKSQPVSRVYDSQCGHLSSWVQRLLGPPIPLLQS